MCLKLAHPSFTIYEKCECKFSSMMVAKCQLSILSPMKIYRFLKGSSHFQWASFFFHKNITAVIFL